MKLFKRGKRAQAFLISAVVIIMILVAFVTISNFSKKTTFSTFNFVAEEIQIESEKVMDYSLFNDNDSVIDDFTKNVSNYLDKDTRIYFITGENQSLNCYHYPDGDYDLYPYCDTSGDPINITIDNTVYDFPLRQGKHFYFIMIKDIRDEKYVYKNQ